MIYDYLKGTFWFVVLVLAFDFGGFVWWILSGQFPVDSVYLGAITKTILTLFI